jgi:hypothetical protein
MNARQKNLIFVLAASLQACAPMAYRQQVDNLRAVSIAEVKGYAYGTKLHLEEHGEEKTLHVALDRVRSKLRDPDSAKFQDVRIVDYNEGKVVCGKVNGKNAYGGYAGFTSFAAGMHGASLADNSSRYNEINIYGNAGIAQACGY